jgi:hypothetical protein
MARDMIMLTSGMLPRQARREKGDRKMAMTAPVTQVAVPVSQTEVARRLPGAVRLCRMTSTSPPRPEPLDVRIKLRVAPASHVAANRYSGFWSDSNYDDHLARLQAALSAAKLIPTGQPVCSRYDPPSTPRIMRRNEIWLPLPDRP